MSARYPAAQGPQGIPGATGATGPSGPTGAGGPTGATGATGAAGEVQLGGDIGGTPTAPRVTGILGQATPFGPGGLLRSTSAADARLYANYDQPNNLLIDNTKPAWLAQHDSGDVFSIKRAPAGAGAPVFDDRLVISPTGATLKGAVTIQSTASLAIGPTSSTIDGIGSRLLIQPTSTDNAQNAITVKAPNTTWGVGQTYGKGQVFLLLKSAAVNTDIGYAGVSPDDLIPARMDALGRIGVQGIHIAAGLRQSAGYTDNYAVKINPYVDMPFLLMQGTGITQTQPFLRGDTPASVQAFRIDPNGSGVFGEGTGTGAGKGWSSGGIGLGSTSYFGAAHSDRANSTDYAIAQGANGDTRVNCASGQSIGFYVAGTIKAFMDASSFTLGMTMGVGANYIQGAEMTAPAAPPANNYRLYAEDDGTGRTRLMCKFNTGAAQQVAIQP